MYEKARKELGLDDTIDMEAHWDHNISYSENIENLKEEFGLVIDEKATEKLQEEKYKAQWQAFKDEIDFSVIDNITSLAVVGRRNSGKTALAYHVLGHAKKPVYFFRHPKPHIVRALGYHILHNFEQITKLSDCVVYIDEPQLFIKKYDKKANDGLLELLSIARQRNVCIVLSSSDTRFITKGLEAYIDVWLVKDIETELVKRGSLVSKIIRKNAIIDADGFTQAQAQFLFYSRDYPQWDGQHEFNLPTFWSEAHSKPFSLVKHGIIDTIRNKTGK